MHSGQEFSLCNLDIRPVAGREELDRALNQVRDDWQRRVDKEQNELEKDVKKVDSESKRKKEG